MTEKQAKILVLMLMEEFPGLIDGETTVNGSYLTEWLSIELVNAINASTREASKAKGAEL